MSKRGGSRGKRKRGKRKAKVVQAPVVDTHVATQTRVAAAIKKLGWSDFKNYLLARTNKPDGSTWTLSAIAAELEMPAAVFISYHAWWVDRQRESSHA